MKATAEQIQKDTADWTRGPADRHAVSQGCYFDLAAADRVRQFFRKFLKHSTGQWAGQAFELLPWQWESVIAPLFGWKRADGLRRFTRGYISTGKKNGKTGLLSGLALYLLLADGEANAEIYSAASDREQAGIVFKEMAKMVDASTELKKCCRYKETSKTVIGKGRSFYRALSAEAGTKDGPNASAILFDELHAQPNRELFDKLRYAGAARKQPLFLSTTTAGSELETICGEEYSYAQKVISGEILDTTYLAFIAEADPKDDWSQESTWHKANPSLGVTISLEKFRADFQEAKESPAKENSFRRYRLNQWTQTADSWLSMDAWDACPSEIDIESLAGRECYAGLDLSACDDTTALVLLFPEDDGSTIALPFFWLPEQNIVQLERKHRQNYRAWAGRGLFRLTSGNVIDYNEIRAQVNEIGRTYQIKKLSIDRKFQGQALENDLISDGFEVVAAGQGWVSQDLPAKELEKLIKSAKLNHGSHPVLRWHAMNVVVDIDKNGNYTINKKRSRSKIDGIAALLMALFSKMQDVGTTAEEDDGELITLDW